MTLDEYLEEKKMVTDRIRYKMSKLEYYESKATKCTVSFDPMAGLNATRNLHPMEDALVEMMQIKEQLETARKQLRDLDDKFRATIHLIGEPKYELVLELKYIGDCTWKEISKYMNYSRTQLHRYLDDALARLHEVENT